ncbi:hypothetical protein AHAS_Ahas03G0239900 [Arachis hypogaea]
MCNPRVAVKDRGESRGRGSINFGCSVTTHTTQHTPPSFPSFIPSFPPYPLCHSPPQLLPASLFSTSKSNLIPVGEAKVSGVRLLPSLSPLLLFLFGVTNEVYSTSPSLILIIFNVDNYTRSKFHDIAEVYKPCQRDVVKTELKHQCWMIISMPYTGGVRFYWVN